MNRYPHRDFTIRAFGYWWRLTFWRRRYGAVYSGVEFTWFPIKSNSGRG